MPELLRNPKRFWRTKLNEVHLLGLPTLAAINKNRKILKPSVNGLSKLSGQGYVLLPRLKELNVKDQGLILNPAIDITRTARNTQANTCRRTLLR